MSWTFGHLRHVGLHLKIWDNLGYPRDKCAVWGRKKAFDTHIGAIRNLSLTLPPTIANCAQRKISGFVSQGLSIKYKSTDCHRQKHSYFSTDTIKLSQGLPDIMQAKLFVFICALAAANAGYIGMPSVLQYQIAPITHVEPHAITSTSDNILRSPGNLAQIATQTKTIDTPFSSSSKTDIRVSNPALTYTQFAHPATPLAYTAAAIPATVRAPAAALGVAYSPAVEVSHMSYSSPIGIAYAY